MFKNKLFVGLFCVVLLLSLCVSTVSAATTVNLTTTPANVYGKSAKDIMPGSVSPSTLTPNLPILSINLPVTPFVQTAQPWCNDLMKTANLSIGGYGCALTDATMVTYFYGNTATNPRVFNIAQGNYACPLDWWQIPNCGGYGYISSIDTIVASPTADQVISICRNALQAGEPVIVGYQKHPTSEHYLLVKAVYNYGTQLSDFYCIDPLDGSTYSLSSVVGSLAFTKAVCYYKK